MTPSDILLSNMCAAEVACNRGGFNQDIGVSAHASVVVAVSMCKKIWGGVSRVGGG